MSFIMNDTQECLHYANAFYNVAYNIDLKDIKMYIPFAVNATFACELYIKYIMAKENGQYEKGHDIYKLFLKLASPTQSFIENSYKQKCTVDLFKTLKEEGSNFVDWRYAFENTDISVCHTFWIKFSSVLKNYAESLK